MLLVFPFRELVRYECFLYTTYNYFVKAIIKKIISKIRLFLDIFSTLFFISVKDFSSTCL